MLDTVRIADIQTTDVLYYDANFKDEFDNFCNQRNIDILPCIESPNKYFLRNRKTNTFKEEISNPTMQVEGSLNIFQSRLLEKFEFNHVLFVYTNQEFTGVIHFSDYNKSIVSLYLYNMIFIYENTLRDILKTKLNNNDMFMFFENKSITSDKKEDKDKYKRRVGSYIRELPKIVNTPQFQTFYIDDLMNLTHYSYLIEIDEEERNTIKDLRNTIMHTKDLINQDDNSTEDLIYNFPSFRIFFNSVLVLQKNLLRAKNRLKLLQEAK